MPSHQSLGAAGVGGDGGRDRGEARGARPSIISPAEARPPTASVAPGRTTSRRDGRSRTIHRLLLDAGHQPDVPAAGAAWRNSQRPVGRRRPVRARGRRRRSRAGYHVGITIPAVCAARTARGQPGIRVQPANSRTGSPATPTSARNSEPASGSSSGPMPLAGRGDEQLVEARPAERAGGHLRRSAPPPPRPGRRPGA